MASSEDLTDDQIERLLAEAEVRLSTRKSPSEKAVTKQGEQPVVIHAGSRPEAGPTQGHAEQATRGQNLTVRIAQLPEKKKSKVSSTPSPGCLHCMMRTTQSYSNDASRYPVMGDAPAPP